MSDAYAYRIIRSDEGICAEFPSLSWLASDRDEALAGIRALVADCVADMRACGDPLPEAAARSVQPAHTGG